MAKIATRAATVADTEETVTAPAQGKTVEEQMEELVEYTAPFIPGTDRQPDVIAGVNGEIIRFKRGIPVKIKRKFYEVLMNAQAQQLSQMRFEAQAQAQSKKALADM